jgi:error-prone DNA polymerase
MLIDINGHGYLLRSGYLLGCIKKQLMIHRVFPAGLRRTPLRFNFSFLRGASHAEELVARAVALGYAALAITDECSFRRQRTCPPCRARAAAETDPRHRTDPGLRHEAGAAGLQPGRLRQPFRAGHTGPAPGGKGQLPPDARRPGRLGRRRGCRIAWRYGCPLRQQKLCLRQSRGWYPLADGAASVWLPCANWRRPWPAAGRGRRRAHAPARAPPAAGRADRHAPRRARWPQAGTRCLPTASATCANAAARAPLPARAAGRDARGRRALPFSLAELRYEYPEELVPGHETPASTWLRADLAKGMRNGGMPAKVGPLIEHELALIAELKATSRTS